MEQLNLFDSEPNRPTRPPKLTMGKDALIQWKSRIFDHQQRVKDEQPLQQTTLFDLTPNHCDPDSIDPFGLKLRQWQFFRELDGGDETCIYFIIDNALPLLLYVGETKQTPKQRWGVHDCRSYIENYLDLNYKHQLKTFVGIGFWWDTPVERKARQQLEQALIQKWKSPFNKECWNFWGKPFG